MSSDIQDLVARLERATKTVKTTVKAPPRWLSSRLWITAGGCAALLWMMQGQVAAILWQITILVTVFLVCRTATDIVTTIVNGKVKEQVTIGLAKEGLLKSDE
jgi:hypothetical protein